MSIADEYTFTMNVLVAGGCGFIGSNFVKLVLNGEFPSITSLTVIDKLSYAGNLENFSKSEMDGFKFVKGAIQDEKVLQTLESSRFDAVINFAAESHVDRSIGSPGTFVENNILGTQMLLELFRKCEWGTFLQVSTDEVYGSISEGSWDEECPLLPNSPYSASKASADLICRSYRKTFNLDVRITRCSNNYGPYQFPEKVIPVFITNLLQGKPVPIYGDGRNVRDWLHVKDHCRGIVAALTKGRAGEIYNIGGGRELSNLDLASNVLRVMGFGPDRIEYVPDRLGHDLRYSVSHAKASSELGYEPEIAFENGLEETVSWYQNNANWWKPLLARIGS